MYCCACTENKSGYGHWQAQKKKKKMKKKDNYHTNCYLRARIGYTNNEPRLLEAMNVVLSWEWGKK